MNSGQFIQWQDLFALVDDGLIRRYEPFEAAIREQSRVLSRGLAVMCILPPQAKPPPDDVKQAAKGVLLRLASSISCLSYVIEGTGFRGVAARATLVGMKIFSSRPYPIYVETSVHEALVKMIPHMAREPTMPTVNAIMRVIADGRTRRAVPQPGDSPSVMS